MRNFGFCLLITSLWLLLFEKHFDWINVRCGDIINGIGTLSLLILFHPVRCFFILGICLMVVSILLPKSEE